jgi:hypothetical protein
MLTEGARSSGLITGKCARNFTEWKGKLEGESAGPGADRYRRMAGRCLYKAMCETIKVTKTKTAVNKEAYAA